MIIMESIEARRRLRKERNDLLQNEPNKAKSTLINLGAVKLIQFGSLVDGEIHRWSDIDLLVVMPDTKSSKEWRRIIYDHLDVRVGIDLLMFTVTELRENIPYSGLLKSILQKGVVIYET